MIVCHMRWKVQTVILFGIDISLDNQLTLLKNLCACEILDLRNILVMGYMA